MALPVNCQSYAGECTFESFVFFVFTYVQPLFHVDLHCFVQIFWHTWGWNHSAVIVITFRFYPHSYAHMHDLNPRQKSSPSSVILELLGALIKIPSASILLEYWQICINYLLLNLKGVQKFFSFILIYVTTLNFWIRRQPPLFCTVLPLIGRAVHCSKIVFFNSSIIKMLVEFYSCDHFCWSARKK